MKKKWGEDTLAAESRVFMQPPLCKSHDMTVFRQFVTYLYLVYVLPMSYLYLEYVLSISTSIDPIHFFYLYLVYGTTASVIVFPTTTTPTPPPIIPNR